MTSQQLKEARQSMGLTITQMAAELNGTARGTYIKWEKKGKEGRRVPKMLPLAIETIKRRIAKRGLIMPS